ncbi:NYN domain-containing protein [Cohnella thermotolerans]|jgi:predicted RNA-binding protein with PIN domain|uniref:NYN domain-containing protein n=1 Tax=Cohnella thermotolerans TaxID=329858 RepID=UPI0003FB2DF6|nr:NYN domain-containing protein [Cohnella thermotolerans]
MLRREDVLIVDGYNMIGAWPELEKLKRDRLEDARDRLLDLLANYQSYAGVSVSVVFDAFRVPGLGAAFKQHRVNVVFTREKETADECIERLVGETTSVKRNVYVATSDQTEQRVAFGRGALRLSARELRLAVEESRREIERTIRKEPPPKRNPLGSVLAPDIQLRLERMRRGQGTVDGNE